LAPATAPVDPPAGGNAIGVISEENERGFVLSLGTKGVINRKGFNAGADA
jgi:hypothetical protein